MEAFSKRTSNFKISHLLSLDKIIKGKSVPLANITFSFFVKSFIDLIFLNGK